MQIYEVNIGSTSFWPMLMDILIKTKWTESKIKSNQYKDEKRFAFVLSVSACIILYIGFGYDYVEVTFLKLLLHTHIETKTH